MAAKFASHLAGFLVAGILMKKLVKLTELEVAENRMSAINPSIPKV